MGVMSFFWQQLNQFSVILLIKLTSLITFKKHIKNCTKSIIKDFNRYIKTAYYNEICTKWYRLTKFFNSWSINEFKCNKPIIVTHSTLNLQQSGTHLPTF